MMKLFTLVTAAADRVFGFYAATTIMLKWMLLNHPYVDLIRFCQKGGMLPPKVWMKKSAACFRSRHV